MSGDDDKHERLRAKTRRLLALNLSLRFPLRSDHEAEAVRLEAELIDLVPNGYARQAKRVLEVFSFWNTVIDPLGWWENCHDHDGSFLSCEKYHAYALTYKAHIPGVMSNKSWLDRYIVTCVWYKVVKKGRDIMSFVRNDHTNTFGCNRIGLRFLVDALKHDNIAHAEVVNHFLNHHGDDPTIRLTRGWWYFFGLNGMTQSYDDAMKDGIPSSMCEPRANVTNAECLIVINVIANNGWLEKREMMRLRLVCKAWNARVLHSGKFWQQNFSLPAPKEHVPLAQLGEYVICQMGMTHVSHRRCPLEQERKYNEERVKRYLDENTMIDMRLNDVHELEQTIQNRLKRLKGSE